MRTYHCFLVARDGHLADVAFADCGDDAAAIRWAERRSRNNPVCREIEIWEGDRLVSTRARRGGRDEPLATGPVADGVRSAVAPTDIGSEPAASRSER